jgi:hypothetical protein
MAVFEEKQLNVVLVLFPDIFKSLLTISVARVIIIIIIIVIVRAVVETVIP